MRISPRGVAATLLVLALAATCIRLGFWQIDRLEQRRARNAALSSALALPPLELRDSLAAVLADPASYADRRVRVRGSYDPATLALLRGRSEGGRPGVHLVEALRVAGDTAVLVNRGWLPAADAATVDPRPHAERGERVVEGILLPAPAGGDGAAREIEVGGARVRSYARLPLDSLRAAGPGTLLPLYLQQLGDDPAPAGLPRRVPLPALGEGPHLGYAVQWFSFAAIALAGLIILLVRGRRGAG